MKGRYIAVMILFALLWMWLGYYILVAGSGSLLYRIFIVAASAIIIFVPLWKKYMRK
jgi:hypothetical protein